MTDTVTQIETNLDDLSPEITGTLIDKCLAAGALDAFLTPVQMKKYRPAVLLTILAHADRVQGLLDLLFRETTTFGVRLSEKKRVILEREFRTVSTPFGEVRIKLGYWDGRLVQRAPEFESCRALSEQTGQPLRLVYEAAIAAAQTI